MCLQTLLSGNTVLFKHSPGTPDLGVLYEKIFIEAGWSNGEFINVQSSIQQAETIIADPRVHGLSFTGSTGGG